MEREPGRSATDGPVLIGIDVGTTSLRAIAFDRRGRRVAESLRPSPMKQVGAGGEYDPDAIFASIVDILTELGRALAGRPVAGIAAVSVGESCVVLDAAGRPLAPSIIWYDRRSAPEARAIEAQLGRDRVFEISGHAVEPIFTLAKLLWMRRHWPDAVARAKRVLLMADWVAFRLSGEAATDATLASRTLYFDIRRRVWSDELLALAGFATDFPAPLRPSGTSLGTVRSEILAATGLAGAPVVAVGGHDHIIGALATGLNEPGAVINSAGTAEAVMLATQAPLADPEVLRRGYVQGAIETDRPFGYVAGSLLSAGGTIDWARAMLGNPPQAGLIAAASAVPAGSHGVMFLPHLANSPPPKPDENARGAFLGLTLGVTPATLYRAVLEGVALQSRAMLDGMLGLEGIGAPGRVRFIGGTSRNPLFVAIKANAFGRPLTVVEEADATALGAALLSGVAAGLFPSLDAAVENLERAEYGVEPDASSEAYEALRAAYERVLDAMPPVNRALATTLAT